VRAFARDAQSLDVVLNRSDWHIAQGRPIACLGAGGSAIALLLATQISVPTTIAAGHVVVPRDPGTPELTIVGRRHDSLDEIQRVVSRAGVTLETVRLRARRSAPS
jgi:shikimate 5-dehydrogenase